MSATPAVIYSVHIVLEARSELAFALANYLQQHKTTGMIQHISVVIFPRHQAALP
jgi:hypothetical protein